MLLHIRHQSRYTYEEPVHYALQRVRMTPGASRAQLVRAWSIRYQGAAPELAYVDGFGNLTQLVRTETAGQEVVITVEGAVETLDTAGVHGEDSGPAPLWTWLRQTPLTTPGAAIRELAAAIGEPRDPLDALHRLLLRIHERIRFTVGATDTATPGEAALAAGEGVCQDHAHVFIGAARLLDIPARYVSGYLLLEDAPDQAASHAWAEAHVEGLGWVGFDGANGVSPDGRYVRVATGLDYRDAAPISGIRQGRGGERLAVDIRVEQ
jgi:transglutaminase-like putative cysteine protease